VNPGAVQHVETLLTFESDQGSDVKMFLCYGQSNQRVVKIGDESLVDPL